MDEGFALRDGGTVCPYLGVGVDVGAESETVGFQFVGKAFHFRSGVYPGIDSHYAALWQDGTEPFGDGGCAFYLFFHQFEASAGQLFRGLDEVAGVCPQGGLVGGYYCCACRTGKSTNPAACLPAFGDVLSGMWVGAGCDEGVYAFTQHKAS